MRIIFIFIVGCVSHLLPVWNTGVFIALANTPDEPQIEYCNGTNECSRKICSYYSEFPFLGFIMQEPKKINCSDVENNTINDAFDQGGLLIGTDINFNVLNGTATTCDGFKDCSTQICEMHQENRKVVWVIAKMYDIGIVCKQIV